MKSLACLPMTNFGTSWHASLVYLSVKEFPYSDLILQGDLELLSERFQASFLLVQSCSFS